MAALVSIDNSHSEVKDQLKRITLFQALDPMIGVCNGEYRDKPLHSFLDELEPYTEHVKALVERVQLRNPEMVYGLMPIVDAMGIELYSHSEADVAAVDDNLPDGDAPTISPLPPRS